MSSANAYLIHRAHREDAYLSELADLEGHALRVTAGSIHGFHAGCPLATPDRPTRHTHGDPLSPTSWPCPAWSRRHN